MFVVSGFSRHLPIWLPIVPTQTHPPGETNDRENPYSKPSPSPIVSALSLWFREDPGAAGRGDSNTADSLPPPMERRPNYAAPTSPGQTRLWRTPVLSVQLQRTDTCIKVRCFLNLMARGTALCTYKVPPQWQAFCSFCQFSYFFPESAP